MLTSVAIFIALSVLVVLLIIWGQRYQKLVVKYRRENAQLRGRLEISTRTAEQWRAESQRLRRIVDRVES